MQSFVPVQYYDLTSFQNPEYRTGYLETKIYGGIAYQIQALRGDLTQKEFAQKVGMKQSAISRLESIEYGKANVKTLLRIARRCDVALVIQFVSYPEFLERTSDMSQSKLQPPTIYESIERQKTFRSLGTPEPTSLTSSEVMSYRISEDVVGKLLNIEWQSVNSNVGHVRTSIMASDVREYMSTREAEDYSGLRGLAKRRVLGTSPPYVKTCPGCKSSRVLYSRAAIDAWMRERVFKNTSEHSAAQAMAVADAG